MGSMEYKMHFKKCILFYVSLICCKLQFGFQFYYFNIIFNKLS